MKSSHVRKLALGGMMAALIFVAVQASLVVAGRGYSLVCVGFHCCGFSCCGAQTRMDGLQ